jgi:hypothetical protein
MQALGCKRSISWAQDYKGDVSQLNSGGYLLPIFRSPHKKEKIQIENIYIYIYMAKFWLRRFKYKD